MQSHGSSAKPPGQPLLLDHGAGDGSGAKERLPSLGDSCPAALSGTATLIPHFSFGLIPALSKAGWTQEMVQHLIS